MSDSSRWPRRAWQSTRPSFLTRRFWTRMNALPRPQLAARCGVRCVLSRPSVMRQLSPRVWPSERNTVTARPMPLWRRFSVSVLQSWHRRRRSHRTPSLSRLTPHRPCPSRSMKSSPCSSGMGTSYPKCRRRPLETPSKIKNKSRSLTVSGTSIGTLAFIERGQWITQNSGCWYGHSRSSSTLCRPSCPQHGYYWSISVSATTSTCLAVDLGPVPKGHLGGPTSMKLVRNDTLPGIRLRVSGLSAPHHKGESLALP